MDSMDNENDEQCCIVEPMWWAVSSGGLMVKTINNSPDL